MDRVCVISAPRTSFGYVKLSFVFIDLYLSSIFVSIFPSTCKVPGRRRRRVKSRCKMFDDSIEVFSRVSSLYLRGGNIFCVYLFRIEEDVKANFS